MTQKNILLVALGCTVVLGLVFLLIRHLDEQTRVQQIINEHSYNVATWKALERQNKKQESVSSSQPTPSGSESVEDRCVIKRTDGILPEVVLRSAYCYTQIERWGDWLFFPEGDGYQKEDIQLVAYDIKTGDKRTLYSLKDRLVDFGSEEIPVEISSIRVIGDKLYFGLGGYLTGSVLYSLPLPLADSVTPKLIVANQFTDVVYEYDRYWLTGGTGDGGGSYAVRAPFDPATDTYGRIIETGFDMGIGTEFIGAQDSQAYIAEFVEGPADPRGLGPTLSAVSRIYALDIRSHRERTIFSKTDVVFPIQSVYYHAEENRFIFFSHRQVYSYALRSKEVALLGLMYDDVYRFLRVGDLLCLDEADSFNLTTNQYISGDVVCADELEADMLQVKFPRLQLPLAFILETRD